MKQVKIINFGACGIDEIRDKTLTRELIYREEGRKSSHQAWASKLAGAESMLVSFVGNDENGKYVLDSLAKRGFKTDYIKVIEGELTEVNIQLLDPKTKDYELERGPNELSQYFTPEMVNEYREQILAADFVVLVSKHNYDFLVRIINFCYENNKPTILTISHPKFELEKDHETLEKVSVIVGNLDEVKNNLTSEDNKGLSEIESPEEMLKILPNLMVTSAGGVWFCDEDGNTVFQKSVSVPQEKIIETNGAGDTFAGNYVVFKAEGETKTNAVRLGQCAAALEIQKMGVLDAMPHRDETLRLYHQMYDGHN
ncbi:carbohydrate kinase family protein [Candidatus Saccharibacteria bacterium]|nr:carbohydrate kinase family protein [Candidatus Saccharibacteria bacterium]